jgi:hypothetical protein
LDELYSRKNLSQSSDLHDELEHLLITVHRRGINYRYLGKLRRACQNNQIRKLILTETIARVRQLEMDGSEIIECIFLYLISFSFFLSFFLFLSSKSVKGTLRAHMRTLKTPEISKYHKLVLSYYNLLFGTRHKSEEYWRTFIKDTVSRRYNECLSEDELDSNLDLRQNVYNVALLKRLQTLMGVSLK